MHVEAVTGSKLYRQKAPLVLIPIAQAMLSESFVFPTSIDLQIARGVTGTLLPV